MLITDAVCASILQACYLCNDYTVIFIQGHITVLDRACPMGIVSAGGVGQVQMPAMSMEELTITES